jgi:type I restriction enzyme S subunit
LNKVWVADFEGLCSVDQYVYEVDRSVADTEFIAGFMRSSQYLDRAPVTTGPGQLPRIRLKEVAAVTVDLPSLAEQQRIALRIREQMSVAGRARGAAEAQCEAVVTLIGAYLRETFARGVRQFKLSECLEEVTRGAGAAWSRYRVVGATRDGLAPAKESVGKAPERYKLVEPGTIFYNPMRILLGSIAFIDQGQEPGITSPDYVVFKTRRQFVHPPWFYYWLRSEDGAAFVRSLARGAVRERMLFRRLAGAEVGVPPLDSQIAFARAMEPLERGRVAAQAQLQGLATLTASLLSRTFAGAV